MRLPGSGIRQIFLVCFATPCGATPSHQRTYRYAIRSGSRLAASAFGGRILGDLLENYKNGIKVSNLLYFKPTFDARCRPGYGAIDRNHAVDHVLSGDSRSLPASPRAEVVLIAKCSIRFQLGFSNTNFL
jgi:hypothetical protein